MERRRNQWARILFCSALGLAGAEGFFGVFSDMFDNGTQVGDVVGHFVGLPVSFAVFVGVMAAVLQPERRRVVSWLVATAVLGTFAYFAGYAMLGPPADFALSIAVIGVIFGLMQRSVLRGRGVTGAWRCAASAAVGYTLGAIAGVGAAVVIAPHLPDGTLFYGLLTAILGGVAGAVGGAINGYTLGRLWWIRIPVGPALAR